MTAVPYSHQYATLMGPDDHIVDRLADFFKSTGLTKVVYKSDQEPAIRTAIEAALLKCGRSGEALPDQEVLQMVPENSAVAKAQVMAARSELSRWWRK